MRDPYSDGNVLHLDGIKVNTPAVILYHSFARCFLLGITGETIHEISLYYFLQLRVNLQWSQKIQLRNKICVTKAKLLNKWQFNNHDHHHCHDHRYYCVWRVTGSVWSHRLLKPDFLSLLLSPGCPALPWAVLVPEFSWVSLPKDISCSSVCPGHCAPDALRWDMRPFSASSDQGLTGQRSQQGPGWEDQHRQAGSRGRYSLQGAK